MNCKYCYVKKLPKETVPLKWYRLILIQEGKYCPDCDKEAIDAIAAQRYSQQFADFNGR